MKIPVTYRSPGEYTAWLAGVKAVAELLGCEVDAFAWGGGIPNEVTLTVKAEVKELYEKAKPRLVTITLPKDEPDIFEREAEAANDGDDGQSAPSA